MASLNEIFPGFGETQTKTNQRISIEQTTNRELSCPVCSNRAIRRDAHTGIIVCPIGHQWSIDQKGQKVTPIGMFFNRPAATPSDSEKAQARQFIKGPSMNPNQLMQMQNPYHNPLQHEEEYQQLVRNQHQQLERPKDFDNFAWSTRNLKGGQSMMEQYKSFRRQ